MPEVKPLDGSIDEAVESEAAQAAGSDAAMSTDMGDSPQESELGQPVKAAGETVPPLLATLNVLVKTGQEEEVARLMDNPKHEASLKSIAWDIVPSMCQFLTSEYLIENPDVIGASECVLTHLANVSNPKELILVLLEQADCFKDDIKFKVLLPAIQKCLLRLPSKRSHSMAVALETLYAHIQALPLPHDHDLEGQERVLMDADDTVRRITDVTCAMLEFLQPFVQEVSLTATDNTAREANIHQVGVLLRFLVKLCHHPLAYIDMSDISSKEESSFRAEGHKVGEMTVSLATQLQSDYVKAVWQMRQHNAAIDQQRKRREKHKQKRSAEQMEGEELDMYELEEKVPELGLSVFAYLAIGEDICAGNLPQVYNHAYLLQLCCPFICTLLPGPERQLSLKGVSLLTSVLDRVCPSSVPASLLQLQDLTTMIDMLLHTMVTNQTKEVRVVAAKALPLLLKIFQVKGKQMLLMYVLNKAGHPGVVGYATNLLKDVIDTSLKESQPSEQFSGKLLEKILNVVFSLPDGATSDLLEQSDRIMGALNLLRYLILRDKPDENVTGIWNLMPQIEKTYLQILRTGIDMSRAHYKMELEKVNKGQHSIKPDDLQVNLTVGGQAMPQLTRQQEKQVMQTAIHTFDMMESIVGRVNELATEQRRKQTQPMATDS